MRTYTKASVEWQKLTAKANTKSVHLLAVRAGHFISLSRALDAHFVEGRTRGFSHSRYVMKLLDRIRCWTGTVQLWNCTLTGR